MNSSKIDTSQKHTKNSIKELWCFPPLETSKQTEKLDWLSGLKISSQVYGKSRLWSKNIEHIVQTEELSLKEQIPFNANFFLLHTANFLQPEFCLICLKPVSNPKEFERLVSKTTKDLQHSTLKLIDSEKFPKNMNPKEIDIFYA